MLENCSDRDENEDEEDNSNGLQEGKVLDHVRVLLLDLFVGGRKLARRGIFYYFQNVVDEAMAASSDNICKSVAVDDPASDKTFITILFQHSFPATCDGKLVHADDCLEGYQTHVGRDSTTLDFYKVGTYYD